MYPRTIIDSVASGPDSKQLTRKDLYTHFSTGRSFLLSGSGRAKKFGCCTGVQTDFGDVRDDVWRQPVRGLIVRSDDEE